MNNGCLQKKLTLNFFLVLLISIVSSFQNVSYAAEQIGVVLSVEGKASANSRALLRKSSIFNGDTITTAAASKVSFKFTDGSVVSLSENSNYKINNYKYKSAGTDVFDANLSKGGMKTKTGEIGKEALHTLDAKEAGIPPTKQVKVAYYKQKASVATIGVRGTEYKVLIDESDDKVKVSALDGTIGVDFFDEYVELGDGADASYLEIDLDGNYTIDSYDPIDDEDYDEDDEGDDDEDDEGGDGDDDEEGASDTNDEDSSDHE